MVPGGSSRALGDGEALAQLFETCYDRVARYMAARVSNRAIAEDLAGECFLRAAESIGSYDDRGVPIEAWLFRIAHNLVVDHYRRSARRQTTPIDEVFDLASPSDPAAEVEQALAMEQVRQAMEVLNPAQQEVISLRFMGGLSSEEAGQVMGRTSGAIRELQRTAVRALRGLLGPALEGAEGAEGAKGLEG